MEDIRFEKLDHGLARLLDTPFAKGEKFPVIVRVSDFTHADELEACLSEVSASVRHRLEPLNAVSAWIPLGAIGRIAALEFVDRMELAQPEQVVRD